MANSNWTKIDVAAWFKKPSSRQGAGKKTAKVKAAPAGLTLLDMDLIKDEVPVVFDWRAHWHKLLWFVLLALFLVAQLYLILYFWEKQEINKKADVIGKEITNLNTKIEQAKVKASDALAFEARNKTFTPLFYGHVYWTNLFSYLEKNTLSNVFYSGFNGSLSGSYVLKAGTNDYRAIGAQIKIFTADQYTAQAKTDNENVQGKGKDSSLGVLFDFNLSVKPSLFIK